MKHHTENPNVIEPLLSYHALAGELNIRVPELRQLVYSGIVPCLRLGHRTVKFQRSAVERALKKFEVRKVMKSRQGRACLMG